jgi:hypothetical protein
LSIRSFGRGQAFALRRLHQAVINVGQGLVPLLMLPGRFTSFPRKEPIIAVI